MFCHQQIPGVKLKLCVGRLYPSHCRANKKGTSIMELKLESASLPKLYAMDLRLSRAWTKGSRGSFTPLALSIYLITILFIMLKSKHFFQCCARACCLSCLFVMLNLARGGCYYMKMTENSVDISISYVLLIVQHQDDSTSTIFTYPVLFVFHMPSHCCHWLTILFDVFSEIY